MAGILVSRRQNNVIIREEGEWVRKIFNTPKVNFVTSTLGSGKDGPLDKGHANADEVCYVVRGTLVVYFPSEERYVELSAGDAVLIPATVPHQVFNPGDEMAESIWCAGPGGDFRPMRRWRDQEDI